MRGRTLQSDPSISREAYQRADSGTATRAAFSNRGRRFFAYCVVHASALYAFLTFAMATNGLEFFYFYPREAQTLLGPFGLDAMVWLGTAIFSVFGLTVIGLQDVGSRERRNAWRHVALILGASIPLILLLGFASPSLVPFWWIGTGVLAICWLGFGYGIADAIGGRQELLKSFFGSLLAIGAILETWSVGDWLGSGVNPALAFGKSGADLEMNLTYATSISLPVIYVAAWLSPFWTYIAFKLYQKLKGNGLAEPRACASTTWRTQVELDDLILAIIIILISVVVGFYAYLRDPPWLVGTDAYWRYKDPLDRVTSSGNVLSAAANERHGLYLLILYVVHSVTGLPTFDLVKASPVVLTVCLSVLTYFGVARYRRSRIEGLFAGLFAATTFPTTLGIFASIDANWFAMIVALATLFVLASLEQSTTDTVPKALLVAFCGVLLLLLHPWTWGIMAISTLFAGFLFLARRKWKMLAASLILPLSGLASGALVFTVGSEAEKASLLEALGNFLAPLANQSTVLSPFGVIGDSFKIWAPFLNPLLAVLVVIGTLFLAAEKPSSYKTLVLSWMLVTGVGTFFAVTLQTETWRIWYVQPMWLVAGVGMSALLRGTKATATASGPDSDSVIVAAIILLGGVAVLILQPIVGSWIFYLVAVSPALFCFRKGSENSDVIFATSLILFVSLFFVNHALRSLYPLILDPHNFREH